MRFVRFIVFALPLALAVVGRAQSVHWDPSGGSIPVGQTSALRLVFEECAAKGQPTLPKVADLTLQFMGQGSNTSIINGTICSSETLTYALALTKNHPVDIPAFSVETNKGSV